MQSPLPWAGRDAVDGCSCSANHLVKVVLDVRTGSAKLSLFSDGIALEAAALLLLSFMCDSEIERLLHNLTYCNEPELCSSTNSINTSALPLQMPSSPPTNSTPFLVSEVSAIML